MSKEKDDSHLTGNSESGDITGGTEISQDPYFADYEESGDPEDEPENSSDKPEPNNDHIKDPDFDEYGDMG